MYLIEQVDKSVLYSVFFVVVIIIGAFFIVNLITAIQFFYYNRLKIDREIEMEELKKKEAQKQRLLKKLK
jgi:hypothetical protein